MPDVPAASVAGGTRDAGRRHGPGASLNRTNVASDVRRRAVRTHLLERDMDGDGSDPGPFFHGTKADLQVGDLLTAGFRSNYRPDVLMNHVYFTALVGTAALAAALAAGDGRERVYVVAPTGPFENDPNVTDKKFPGNPTRSYRSPSPLTVVGEVADWVRLTPEERAAWHERLAAITGEIIN